VSKPIITLTETAVTRIQELMAARAKATKGIKVGVATRGCSGLTYKIEYADAQEPGDTLIEQDGVTLLIDRKALLFLIGTEMDFVEEKLKAGFVFNNPNEKGKCGCGESFHV
jgi:iron-sulfur cluster assembly protein